MVPLISIESLLQMLVSITEKISGFSVTVMLTTESQPEIVERICVPVRLLLFYVIPFIVKEEPLQIDVSTFVLYIGSPGLIIQLIVVSQLLNTLSVM